MRTIDTLLNSLQADAPVRQVLIGAFWTPIRPAAAWLRPCVQRRTTRVRRFPVPDVFWNTVGAN